MIKEFILYEQALVLKELGFNESCFGYYLPSIFKLKEYKDSQNKNSAFYNKTVCSAPTYSQAFRWFREKHKLHSYIEGAYPWFRYYINSEDDRFEGHRHLFIEEAELTCLKKLIEIVKTKEI